jgi:hypothetical protein
MTARQAALATLVLAACGDYTAPDSVVFGNIVATQHAQSVNWTAYQTYSINPAVTVVDGTGTVQTTCSVDGTQLVPTIKAQMDQRGYQQVGYHDPAKPANLEFQMTAFLGSQDVYYSNWCAWYGYYYCYPGWTYAGSYSFGSLVIDMGDVLHLTNNPPTIPVVWTNANYGVLASYYNGCSGNGSSVNWARIQSAVNQAFQQSPYITRAAP